MLINILLFQHYFVTYYSQNYASIIGSSIVVNFDEWLTICQSFPYTKFLYLNVPRSPINSTINLSKLCSSTYRAHVGLTLSNFCTIQYIVIINYMKYIPTRSS